MTANKLKWPLASMLICWGHSIQLLALQSATAVDPVHKQEYMPRYLMKEEHQIWQTLIHSFCWLALTLSSPKSTDMKRKDVCGIIFSCTSSVC